MLVTADVAPENTSHLYFYTIASLSDSKSTAIIRQYLHENDNLRWALKPVFLLHLLKHLEEIIYVDNDICFFQPYDFLFNQLKQHSILLTPHWGNYVPLPHEESFKTNYQIGLFNAGFIGATRKGNLFLNWWADACAYKMSKNWSEGFFVDQRYLDMTLIIDENAGIVRHLGCNVGSWNMHQNKRVNKNGEVLIGGLYPVIFIHFNNETIRHILNRNDALLHSFFLQYQKELMLIGTDVIAFKSIIKTENNLLVLAKRKLKLRTRVKFFLYKLAHKL